MLHPMEYADEIYSWAREITADVDRRVEVQIVASKTVPNAGIDRPAIVLASPVFADTEDEGGRRSPFWTAVPSSTKALVAMPYVPMGLPDWYTAVMSNYLEDHRYTADNMWTSASAEELLPGIHRIIDTMPPHPSHFLWLVWGPRRPGRTWHTASRTRRIWRSTAVGATPPTTRCTPTGRARTWPPWPRWPVASNSPTRTSAPPAKFVTDANMARLDRVRADYDPDGRFYPWMGRV